MDYGDDRFNTAAISVAGSIFPVLHNTSEYLRFIVSYLRKFIDDAQLAGALEEIMIEAMTFC